MPMRELEAACTSLFLEYLQEHYRKLEQAYVRAPINAFYEPAIEVDEGVAVIRQDGTEPKSRQRAVVAVVAGIVGILVGLYAIFSDVDPVNPVLDGYVLDDRTLDLPNPGLPGEFNVVTLRNNARDRSTNPSKTVNCNPNSHVLPPVSLLYDAALWLVAVANAP